MKNSNLNLEEMINMVEKLCKKGQAYRRKRMAAGEKSSAYLSGRAVKVCKGQMQGEGKDDDAMKKSAKGMAMYGKKARMEDIEAEDDTEFKVSLKHLLKKHVSKGGELDESELDEIEALITKINTTNYTSNENKSNDETKLKQLKEKLQYSNNRYDPNFKLLEGSYSYNYENQTRQ